ncbi:MAG: ATP synthase subunit I [Methylococcaceae bacterium]
MRKEWEEATLTWLLKTQMTLIGVAVTATWLLVGSSEGISILAGGLVAFIPNAYLAIRMVRPRSDKTPKQILNRFYAGEAIKLALTAVLFFCALQIPDVKPLPLMAGFISALSVFWFALLKK